MHAAALAWLPLVAAACGGGAEPLRAERPVDPAAPPGEPAATVAPALIVGDGHGLVAAAADRAPVDLASLPVGLPAATATSARAGDCGGRLSLGRLVSAPLRVFDDAVAIGLSRDGVRLLRHDPTRIELFDGRRWWTVADPSFRAPGATEPITQIVGGWIEDDVVVFRADTGPSSGAYLWRAGAVTTIADLTTIPPGSSSPFLTVGIPSMAGGAVWFWAEAGSREQSSLYRWADGVLGAAVTPARDGVRVMGTPHPFGGTVTFAGNTGPTSTAQGIYALAGGRLRLAVPPTARAPDGTLLGPLIIGEPVAHPDGMLFVADAGPNAVRRGLWRAGDDVRAVLDPATTRVDELGAFAMVDGVGPFADGDVVLFQAQRVAPSGERIHGLYALRGCTLFPLAFTGAVLDGRTVRHVAGMGSQAVAAGVVLFPVVFSDGSQATYGVRLHPR